MEMAGNVTSDDFKKLTQALKYLVLLIGDGFQDLQQAVEPN